MQHKLPNRLAQLPIIHPALRTVHHFHAPEKALYRPPGTIQTCVPYWPPSIVCLPQIPERQGNSEIFVCYRIPSPYRSAFLSFETVSLLLAVSGSRIPSPWNRLIILSKSEYCRGNLQSYPLSFTEAISGHPECLYLSYKSVTLASNA